MATKVFMDCRDILIIEEGSLDIGLLDDEFLIDIFWRRFKDKQIITVSSHFENLLKFDKVALIQNGSFVESGKPQTLIKTKNSKLNKYMGEMDSELFHLINNQFEGQKEKKVQKEIKIENIFQSTHQIRKRRKIKTISRQENIETLQYILESATHILDPKNNTKEDQIENAKFWDFSEQFKKSQRPIKSKVTPRKRTHVFVKVKTVNKNENEEIERTQQLN